MRRSLIPKLASPAGRDGRGVIRERLWSRIETARARTGAFFDAVLRVGLRAPVAVAAAVVLFLHAESRIRAGSSTWPQLARGESIDPRIRGRAGRSAPCRREGGCSSSSGGRVELSNAAAIDAARAMLLWFEPSVTGRDARRSHRRKA